MKRGVTFQWGVPSYRETVKKENEMDDRTNILICLGASTAANCIPCFEHYFGKAEALNLSPDVIQEAVDLASKVKNGAHIATKTGLERIMGKKPQATQSCCEKSDPSCCG
jgi:alkylhydroperoxidase/carboxymuconolactone decarboxylase family protein YurZ